MISIKRFLDQHLHKEAAPELDVVEALRQVGHLLLEGIASHTVRGRETDFSMLRKALRPLAKQLDQPKSALDLLSSSSDVVDALETYCRNTTEYYHEEKEQMQSMVLMLTDTLADISGQSEVSVGRLQTIEKHLEMASGLNDIRSVRSALETCLRSVRDTAAQQRSSAASTVKRLRDHVDKFQKEPTPEQKSPLFSEADIGLVSEVWEGPIETLPNTYIAGFKLKRVEHIASRFGEAATHQMLSTLGGQLKELVGPKDRLLRWKGTSFVMFINSMATIGDIRAQLAESVAKVGMQHVEIGTKSAMLSIGVDWIVFQQADQASLETVLAEVDSFLASGNAEKSAVGSRPK